MGRYYSDYHTGSFPNQRPLNEAIDPTITGCLLQTAEANPLTIRMLVAAEAVNKFDDLVRNESTTKIQVAFRDVSHELGSDPYSQGMYWGTASTNYTAGSGIACPTPYWEDPNGIFRNRPAPYDFRYDGNKLRFADEQTHAFPLVEAHIQVYNFFTNWGSVVDRFADQINRLYGLGIRKNIIDWPKLVDNQSLAAIDGKNHQLMQAIENYNTNHGIRLSGYRNRLIHDGLIRLFASVERNNSWVVWAPADPQNDASPLTEDALSLCKAGLNNLVQFLNDCYGIMLTQIRSGQPPW